MTTLPSDDPEYIPPAPGGEPSPEGGNPATPAQEDPNAAPIPAGGRVTLPGEERPVVELPTEAPETYPVVTGTPSDEASA